MCTMEKGDDHTLSDDELLDVLLHVIPTDPESLEWKPLLFFLKNTKRLRMNITKENASPGLIEGYLTMKIPTADLPEVVGLVHVLDHTCDDCDLEYQLLEGSLELQDDAIGYFESYRFQLPFKFALLSLVIAPGEFQWIMKNVKKEQKAGISVFDQFMRSLLHGTKQWLKRGNR